MKGSLVALGVALAIPAAAHAQVGAEQGPGGSWMASGPTGTASTDVSALTTACADARYHGDNTIWLGSGTYNGSGLTPSACAGIGAMGPGSITGETVLQVVNPATVGAVPVTTSTCSGAQVLTFPPRGRAVFDVTLGASCAYTFTGGVAGAEQRVTLYERQPSSGSTVYAGTFPSTVKFAGGAPAQSTVVGQVRIVTFATDDGGATVFGGL